MAEPKKSFPMLQIAHWWALRKKFKQSIPGVVTDKYLATVLETEVNSARTNVLPFLEALGIIDDEGKTTERAKLWRDDVHYPEVCEAIVEDVYPKGLLEAVPNPNEDQSQAEEWFADHTGAGAAAVRRMAALYAVLVEADASKQPGQEKKSPPKKAPKAPAKTTRVKANAAVSPALVEADASKQPSHEKKSPPKKAPKAPAKTTRVKAGAAASPAAPDAAASNSTSSAKASVPMAPGININLEIHISADTSPDQIDQIFASMAKHIYKRS